MSNFYKFLSGEIVLLQFPFTDLSVKKVRPGLVVCNQNNEDILIVPISTTIRAEREDITLHSHDYKNKPLPVMSCVRYKKLFTVHRSLIIKKVSELQQKTVRRIKTKIIQFILNS